MLFPVNQSESAVMTTTEPNASFHFAPLSGLSPPDISQLHWKSVPPATRETERGREVRDQLPHPPFFAFFSQQKLILTHNPLQNNYFSTVTSWTDQTLKQNLKHVLPWWWWWWWFCWLFSRPTGLHAPNSVSLRLVAESSERRLVTSWLADWMAPSIRWASCLLSSIIFRILPWEANPHRVAWCQGLCQGVEQATGPWSPFIPPRLPQFRPCIQNTRWRRGKKIPSLTPLLLIPAEKT